MRCRSIICSSTDLCEPEKGQPGCEQRLLPGSYHEFIANIGVLRLCPSLCGARSNIMAEFM